VDDIFLRELDFLANDEEVLAKFYQQFVLIVSCPLAIASF
jgi:hypothetical protein